MIAAASIDTESHAAVSPRYAGARPGSRVPRYPLVFCHGMLGMSLLKGTPLEQGNYFSCMRDFLRERNVEAMFPAVSGLGSIQTRARQLREKIRAWTGEPVNLIAHSMGGLDARCMLSHFDMGGQVKSLTTLGTPHRGTAAADWFCSHLGRLLLPLARLAGMDVEGVKDLRTSACADFNARTPDLPRVHYFSVGATAPLVCVSPHLRRSWCIIRKVEGENDGLVSMRSAVWGKYLDTLPVDHFSMTPDGLFRHPCEKFDTLPFYERLFEELARRGL